MATPMYIPVKGNRKTHSGPLGIVKVTVRRETEYDALYPKRYGSHNPRDRAGQRFEPRPFYYDDNGQMQYKVQCSKCEQYQRREAFSPNRHKRNGLQSHCKTCRAEFASQSRRL